MTVLLDQMLKIGQSRIAVLSDRAVKVIHSNGVVFVTGQKQPVAVLIKHGEALNAFELEGNPMTREHVEDLCPGAWRTMLDAR